MFIKIKMWYLWKKYVLSAFKNEREPYHIGIMKASKSVDEIEAALIGLYYSPDYTSYGDNGQVTSMRKLYVADGIWRQDHVRVFNNGEIKGHNELAPEEDAYAHIEGISTREIDVSEKVLILAKLGGEV